MSNEEVRVEMRKLRKKLRQIENLERLERDLNDEEIEKVCILWSFHTINILNGKESHFNVAIIPDVDTHSTCTVMPPIADRTSGLKGNCRPSS